MSGDYNNNLNPGFAEFCAVLCDISDPDRMAAFLVEVMTPAERHDLALRWELMRRLKQGEPQRQIAAELGISLCKITRGAKILKQEHAISNTYLDAERQDESKDPA